MKTVYGIMVGVSLLFLSGCTTYDLDVKNGRVNITQVTENRSPFGTNMGFARVANCKYEKLNEYDTLTTPTDCNPVTPWVPMFSQGQGGQVVGGALTGLGFGVGSVFSGASGSSAASTSSSVATGGKGH